MLRIAETYLEARKSPLSDKPEHYRKLADIAGEFYRLNPLDIRWKKSREFWLAWAKEIEDAS